MNTNIEQACKKAYNGLVKGWMNGASIIIDDEGELDAIPTMHLDDVSYTGSKNVVIRWQDIDEIVGSYTGELADDEMIAIMVDQVNEMYKPYLSTTEAAEALGVARITIIKWAKSGKIAGAQKIGRDWIIPRQSLDGLEKGPSRWDS
jgi:excisionase family DNA binding protein